MSSILPASFLAVAILLRNAARPPVGDLPLAVQGAEIDPRRQILSGQIEADPEGGEHAPPHLKLDRVVAEDAEMARSAPRRDPRADRIDQTELAFLGETVQVRFLRFLQFGLAAHPIRQPAESVEHEEDDLLSLPLDEGGQDIMHVHSETPPEKEMTFPPVRR
jgi:hypothetical protein